MSTAPGEGSDLRALGIARAALGAIFLLRTTPLLAPFHPSFLPEATPLLGWPGGGWHAPALGVALPSWLVAALCVVRTAAAVAFMLGVRSRPAGVVAGSAGYLVLAQDEFAFLQTLHLLFASTLLFGLTDAGNTFALLPDRPRSPDSSLWLIRLFAASIYAWAGLAKLRPDWLDGRALAVFQASQALRGPFASAVAASEPFRAAAASGVALLELSLGPGLLFRRTRKLALPLAFALHAGIELAAKADVFGWIMAALLLSFWPDRRSVSTKAPHPDAGATDRSEPPPLATR